MYGSTTLDAYFFTTPGFYVLHIPIAVPYAKIYAKASAAGLQLAEEAGPILEQGAGFGRGWIGVEVAKPAHDRPDVRRIVGEFATYEHRGPYSSIGRACKRIAAERPGSTIVYHRYLDDPERTPTQDCRTQILFRSATSAGVNRP